ncbi:hypothetical protein BGW36DRAFT_380518 [Talaromyces proteolyticus]|uniref:VCBS repeat-containing protein n=1 Tax=Talaromyces proteolyticus TaxID=1131652 RepID=A0AAD4KP94_9EURO|nr:uncharacterized protein BGW36DRAFT_380518 [Talaromyces proteolyticus]KAH8696250.1 hypothetical protein BGW36DRAFT_380518 [Talaromyces proteolyticus]
MGEAWVAGIQNASRNGWIEDPVPLSGSSGKGCSSAPTWNPRNQIGSGTGSANIAFADIDGDGKDDYLIFGDGGSVTAYINGGPDVGGNQIWYPQDQIASGIAPSASQVRFGDIWGSSRADYLVVNDDGSVDCWTNAGSNDTAYPGRVTWIQQGQIAASGMGQDGNGVVFADLNGDGRDDYLWVSETGAVTAYLNGAGETGKSSWIPQGTVATGVGANRSEVVFADLNGDGRAEYLWIDTDTGSVKAWLNTASSGGNITWIEWGEVASGVGVGGNDIRFADITGSKRDDYIAIENSNGAIDLWENLCPVASEG